MIVVLDTNVIVSALLSPEGAPAKVVRRWEADEFGVVISPPLLAELRRALEHERVLKYIRLPHETVAGLIERLKTVAAVVEPQLLLDEIHEDPDDNQVLECAVAGNASYIVTGDAHRLRLGEFRGIVILSPAGFLVLTKLARYS